MLNETNETKFYYKANDTKKTKKQQDSSYKKIKNPGPTLQCPRCFLEAGSSKESERGRFGAGNVRTDGVANSRGQGNETGIDWECRKKTRRPESYPALIKARLPVMLRGWEEALGHLVLHWAAAWCETKCV